MKTAAEHAGPRVVGIVLTGMGDDGLAGARAVREFRVSPRTSQASLDSIAGAEAIPDLRQAQELLRWLDSGNFTFLGYKEYELVTDEEGADAGHDPGDEAVTGEEPDEREAEEGTEDEGAEDPQPDGAVGLLRHPVGLDELLPP